ncbi:MAG TPA: DUF309 domain-containing protein [Sandaracinaceae bacterium LLY-WYZ-13_1]|nr:DUF309 domain-containing protein [Sandaracinaceae bacterium LLY-WYZ-13_1]
MVRYCPGRRLPPYAFVPGVHPHPTRDPRGHSHGHPPEPAESALAWGVDLYNHGYFWEAHEAWEGLWRAAPPGSAMRSAYAGLIQCAAACVKLRAGRIRPARRIAARALDHLERADDATVAPPVSDLEAFAARFARWIDAPAPTLDDRPRLALDR